jgi:hypothetical protein
MKDKKLGDVLTSIVAMGRERGGLGKNDAVGSS